MRAHRAPEILNPRLGAFDKIDGIASRFSLQRINSRYRGPCIRVRRGRDNAEKDIPFSDSQLDVGDLVNFAYRGNQRFVDNRMYFDGTNDTVNLGTTPQASVENATRIDFDFTIFGQGSASTQTIFVIPISAVPAIGFEVAISGGFIRFGGRSASAESFQDFSHSKPLLENALNRISGYVDYTNQEIGIRFNGEAYETASRSFTTPTFTRLSVSSSYIGSRYGTSFWYTGVVFDCELRANGTLIHSYLGYGNANSNWTDQTGSANGTLAGSPALYSGQGVDAFVTTWYDQSKIPKNMAQANSANQPRIMQNGVVHTVSGRPALEFYNNGGSTSRLLSDPTPDGAASTVFAVINNAAADNLRKIMISKGTFESSGIIWNYRGDQALGRYDLVSYDGTTKNLLHVDTTAPFRFVLSIFIGSGKAYYMNGTLRASSADNFVGASNTLGLGNASGNGAGFSIQEVVVFEDKDLTRHRQMVEADMNQRWSVY